MVTGYAQCMVSTRSTTEIVVTLTYAHVMLFTDHPLNGLQNVLSTHFKVIISLSLNYLAYWGLTWELK